MLGSLQKGITLVSLFPQKHYWAINKKTIVMLDKRLKIFFVIILILLTIPFVAMQFTNEVNWSPFDFIIAGVLLGTTALICDFSIRKIHSLKHRVIVCLAILTILLLIWIEIAVGIFNSPISGS